MPPNPQHSREAISRGLRARYERPVISLAAALGVAAGCALGNWQLNRAAFKEAIAAATAERSALAPLSVAELQRRAAEPALRYRRVSLTGTWLADKTVLLDNRQMNAQPGFYVVTPLKITDTAQTVLVQRGWLPRNLQQRERLAPFETPAGVVNVEALVAPPPGKLYALGAPEKGLIRQNLDLVEFAAETRLTLLPLSLQQTGDVGGASDGLKRAWPEIQSGVAKHYGYAFQWFGLAALIAGLYVWFQFIRPARARKYVDA